MLLNYKETKITAENNVPESVEIIIDSPQDKIDKLKQLKQLLDDGTLTQEEFEKIKLQIL